MILVRKSTTSETAFNTAKLGIVRYHDLRGNAKQGVEAILWADQGHICAICELHKDTVGGTVEHFLPKTYFGAAYTVDLQLNYWNLYMACTGCNNPKGNELIPAYMFDPRFDPCSLDNLFLDKQAISPKYKQIDGKCKVVIPNPKVKGDSAFYSAMLLDATLELMQQNRNKLIVSRGQEFKTLLGLYSRGRATPPDNQLVQEWKRIRSVANEPSASFPEFVSLRLFLLRQAIKNRGISRQTFESYIAPNL
jgi:uncharacterized protein (TIGR02646 family)